MADFIGKQKNGALESNDQVDQIFNGIIANSVVLSSATKLPDMTKHETELNVSAGLPTAKFVNGEAGKKAVSTADWDKKIIRAEEIACIVPISERMLEDADYDIIGQLGDKIAQEFGRVIDEAVLTGNGKPAGWRDGIITEATTKGKVVPATADLYEDIMGESGIIAKVEESGYIPNLFYSKVNMRAKLRGLRDTTGQPLVTTDPTAPSTYQLDGSPFFINRNGVALDEKFLALSGDFSQMVYSMRKDLTWKLFDQGTITDDNGKVLFSLMENDMVAVRFVMRLGWELPNPVNALDGSEKRYPFALLEKSA